MPKVIMTLIFVLLPPLMASAEPENSREPQRSDISDMVGDWAKPLIDYVKTVMTNHELNSLVNAITVKAIGKGLQPTPGNFRQYVRDTMSSSRDPSIDLWGTPYVFERRGKNCAIVSYGPDKKKNTADDIRREFSLP